MNDMRKTFLSEHVAPMTTTFKNPMGPSLTCAHTVESVASFRERSGVGNSLTFVHRGKELRNEDAMPCGEVAVAPRLATAGIRPGSLAEELAFKRTLAARMQVELDALRAKTAAIKALTAAVRAGEVSRDQRAEIDRMLAEREEDEEDDSY
jgi:hypothetical protein